MFGSADRGVVSMQVIQFVLSKPTADFLREVKVAKARLKFKGSVAYVQTRGWTDVHLLQSPQWHYSHDGSSQKCTMGALKRMWPDAKQRDPMSTWAAFVTSDDAAIVKNLSAAVTAVDQSMRVCHTENEAVYEHTSTFGANSQNKISPAMVEWFLLGEPEVKIVVCSG